MRRAARTKPLKKRFLHSSETFKNDVFCSPQAKIFWRYFNKPPFLSRISNKGGFLKILPKAKIFWAISFRKSCFCKEKMHMNNRKLQNFSACGGPTAGRMCFLLIGTFVCHMPTSKLIYTACALTGRVPGRFAGVGARFYHSQIGLQNMRAGWYASNRFAGVGTRFYHSQNDL